MSQLGVVVLAAGEGKRMRSRLPKVLHRAAGKPLVKHVLTAVSSLEPARVVVVTGHGAEQVQEYLGPDLLYANQPKQLGTADAVSKAEHMLQDNIQDVMVLCGDTPLLTAGTLQRLYEMQADATITMLTTVISDPFGYGRVKRDDGGKVTGIIEQADCSAKDAQIREINSGVYCFKSDWLWDRIRLVKVSPKGEYYLTDLVAMAVDEGRQVQALCLADDAEVMGVNDRRQLAIAEEALRRRTAEELMLSGVTIVDPATAYIDDGVKIGMDTVIQPNTIIERGTVIGENCSIGPNSHLVDAVIGDGCRVWASVIEKSEIGSGVTVGPFSHLRPGTKVADNVHIGNFSEIKGSAIGRRTHVGHFSYVGDAVIGSDVNIGAGTVTCNFDGVSKHQTTIGDGVFIGSDTMLVAPVKIGRNAKTGAGSVVTRDVADSTTVYGVPAKQTPAGTQSSRVRNSEEE